MFWEDERQLWIEQRAPRVRPIFQFTYSFEQLNVLQLRLSSRFPTCSRSRSLSLPSHSSSLPSSPTPPLPLWDNPRLLSPSTIPFPDASSHKSKTSRMAAGGSQWKLLCLILSILSNDRATTWGFTKCLNDKAGTRYFCDHILRLHHGHHQKRYVGMDDREHELTLTERNSACTWWPNK